MSAKIEQALKYIEELTVDEQRHVRQFLDRLLGPSHEPSPTQRRLMDEGKVRAPADPRKCRAFHTDHQPIRLGGALVSEQIVEERR